MLEVLEVYPILFDFVCLLKCFRLFRAERAFLPVGKKEVVANTSCAYLWAVPFSIALVPPPGPSQDGFPDG